MQRDIYDESHELYRQTVREFIVREVTPNYEAWESAGMIDRRVFKAGCAAGIYGLEIPERFGGSAVSDYRYRSVVCEEMARARATSVSISFTNQDDLILYYLLDLGTEEQLRRWIPGMASGDLIGALAMTEPGAGSDLRGMRSTATRDGDDWILNGQKTFITHALSADIVIVAARTESTGERSGLSLFIVEDGMEGFSRGRKLDKVGLRSQDTGELFFDNVRLPASHLLGSEGRGLNHMMSHLPRERLGTSITAVAEARAILDLTLKYCFERQAFGQYIGDFQANRFSLAEMATELDIAETYIDKQLLDYNAGRLTPVDAAKGKWWTTELQKRVVDQCVQLHGGYGYMMEYPVARAYVDTRIQTIYGGTTEIMKEIIGRDLARGLAPK
ncbi:Long-chain-acyl-CoA dehydrogenase [Mycolicibacterium rhodesiae JS60]|nr:Long-chain-acyl-CoA dehydrogenase [Mycolicibacterium rhodesiae JS60]